MSQAVEQVLLGTVGVDSDQLINNEDEEWDGR